MQGERKRGRPTKVPLAAEPSAVGKVKQMVKDYSDAKLRSRYFENRRQSLIRRAKVDLQRSEEQGLVIYDRDEVSDWPEKDKAVMQQYITDKQVVLCIEKGIASIEDEKTRRVASETLLEGRSVDEIARELHIPRATAFREKARSVQWIACFMDAAIGQQNK